MTIRPDHYQPKNELLARLPRPDLEHLTARAEAVQPAIGAVLCDPGRPLTNVYFPNSGILSSMVVLEDGSMVEAAMIGNEGMAGIALLVDAAASPHRVVQQLRGDLLRVPAADFRAALAESVALHELTERYAMALLQQCGQNVACAAHHGMNARMCRWLLACTDRADADEFDLTHESLAQILGVRRQTVGVTAQLLLGAELISYRRGKLKIRDRRGLERRACECYHANKEAYGRVMQLSSVPSHSAALIPQRGATSYLSGLPRG